MNIRHHVSEEFLYLYTSGELGPLWSLAVATHLAFCPHCRRRAADLEEVQGVALEQETPEPIMQLQAMDVIAQAGQVKEHAPYRMRTDKMGDAPVFPTPLRDLHGDLKDIRWRTVGGGVQQCVLRRDGNVSARLLKIPPGVAVPSHGHGGVEFTQVLSGGYFDGEIAFTRGDIQIVAHESPHQPIAMSDEYCICLAITDAPLRFTALLPRLFQPLFRI
jgi:putative transcriptional regulator